MLHMAWADLLPQFPHLQMHSIQHEHEHVLITLVSTRESDRCPMCQAHSQTGHGWFTRRIHSLPCSGRAVVFLIQARRFRCLNATCPRQTFREDLSALAERYQRRTQAVTHLLCSVAAVAGGQAGARLTAQMQLPASRSTLLRCLTRQVVPPESAPRVVGVDDFAWTKRRRYGTILVDLEKHRLLALLADCEVETVASWFRQHPSVQIVTRDRSLTFADAIRQGVPHALHVADRFHLHMNAMTCLETLLTREQATLRRVATTLRAEHRQAHPAPPPKPLAPEQQRSARRARRYARYQQVVQLEAQGWSQRAIAQEIGLHPQTVAIYLKAWQFPERAPPPSPLTCDRAVFGVSATAMGAGGAQWTPSVRGNPGTRVSSRTHRGVYRPSALAHTWANSQPGSREGGAPVSVIFSKANAVAPLQRAGK